MTERIKLNFLDGKRTLTTDEAAEALNRKPQTLRIWACKGYGPLTPVRVNGRLAWNRADVEALLNGDMA